MAGATAGLSVGCNVQVQRCRETKLFSAGRMASVDLPVRDSQTHGQMLDLYNDMGDRSKASQSHDYSIIRCYSIQIIMMFMLMISHEREPHLIIGVAALHHHARNSYSHSRSLLE